MDESEFEGSVVLERLAAIDRVDAFFEAVDADDFRAAERLMRLARIEPAMIALVLRKMAAADGEH